MYFAELQCHGIRYKNLKPRLIRLSLDCCDENMDLATTVILGVIECGRAAKFNAFKFRV